MEDSEYNNRISSDFDSNSLEIGEPTRIKEGRESYMIYPILQNSSITSHHRYRDFEWLRRELNQKYPACSTSSLPEKEGVSSYWTSQDSLFYKFRRHGLEQFIRKIANHPKLCKSIEFQSFLQDDELKFAIRVKNSESAQGWYGYFTNLGASIAGVVSTYINNDSSAHDQEDFEFSSHRNEIAAVLAQQETLCQQGRNLVASEESEISASQALGKACENMAKVEKESLCDKLKVLAETHLQIAEVQKANIDKLKEIVGQLMEDNKRATQGLIEALDRRCRIKAEQEHLTQFDLRELDSDIREEIKRFNQEKNFLSQKVSKELVLYKQELCEKVSEIWTDTYNRIKD